MRARMGNERAVTRRGFVAGMSLGALTAAGGLAGCSQGQAAQPEPASSEVSAGRINPDAVMDTDVLIIGGGMSGLACAVQAAQEGAAMLVVEKAPSLGGKGVGVEGIFGVDSPLQQEQGIEVNRSDVIQLEVSDSQYRSDGSLWVDLVDNSGGNIAWLQEQGVRFSGVVDNFFLGKFSTMHYFEEGTAAVGYVPITESPCTPCFIDENEDNTST